MKSTFLLTTILLISLFTTTNLNAQEKGHGIYDDFALMKTENPDMQLLALHKDGSMIGFRLAEDMKQVMSLVYKKDMNAPDFVLLFNEEGEPRGAGIGTYFYNIEKLNEKEYKAVTFDENGSVIKEIKLEIPLSGGKKIEVPNKKGSGPSYREVTLMFNALKTLNEWIQNHSTLMSTVSCAVALPSGIGAVGPCGSLLLDQIMKTMPEESLEYKRLMIIKQALNLITFSSPTGFIEKYTVIVDGMAVSSQTIVDLLDKYYPQQSANPQANPKLQMSAENYPRKEGLAKVLVKYSEFAAGQNNDIELYEIDSENISSFMDRYEINDEKGNLEFEIPFNGKYELRAVVNGVETTKAGFTVSGEDASANPKFKDFICMNCLFSGGIYTETKSADRPTGPMMTPFRIEANCCKDSRISPYGIQKQLKITWSGNAFYATFARNKGVSYVVYNIKGRISNDGSMLKYINMKSVSTNRSYNGSDLTTTVCEVVLENIPFNTGQNQFYASTLKEPLKSISYRQKHTSRSHPKTNYTKSFVEKDGYLMSRENSFLFKLKFFKKP